MNSLRVAISLALFSILVGCGGEVSSTNESAIGTSGGTVTSSDGMASIMIPSGALSATTEISISRGTSNSYAPQGSIGEVIEFGPTGTAFAVPVTITTTYDPSLIPEGVAESDLTLAYAVDTDWIDIPTSVDTVNKKLIGQTTHFSTYAITTSSSNRLPYGSLIGTSLNGVAVYSNGCVDPSFATQKCIQINGRTYADTFNMNNPTGLNTGLQWQCVELINRFYYRVYGKNIRIGGGNARDYFSDSMVTQKGLIKYRNDGSSLPRVGDILVSVGDGSAGNVGHVAIVKSVGQDAIHVIEQNWHEGPGDLNHRLSITPSNKIANFSSSYPTTGWLRLQLSGQQIVFQPGPEGFDSYFGTVFAPGPNGDVESMHDGGWGDFYHNYFRWDLSALPPANEVQRVHLHLYFGATGRDPAFQVKRVTTPWNEATLSRINAPTAVSWGSWNGIVATGWHSLDVTELYTNWQNGTWANYGIQLSPTANDQTNGYIYSSDYQADTALRPKLVITMR